MQEARGVFEELWLGVEAESINANYGTSQNSIQIELYNLSQGASMSCRQNESLQTFSKVSCKCLSQPQSTIRMEYASASAGVLQRVTSCVYQFQHALRIC